MQIWEVGMFCTKFNPGDNMYLLPLQIWMLSHENELFEWCLFWAIRTQLENLPFTSCSEFWWFVCPYVGYGVGGLSYLKWNEDMYVDTVDTSQLFTYIVSNILLYASHMQPRSQESSEVENDSHNLFDYLFNSIHLSRCCFVALLKWFSLLLSVGLGFTPSWRSTTFQMKLSLSLWSLRVMYSVWSD